MKLTTRVPQGVSFLFVTVLLLRGAAISPERRSQEGLSGARLLGLLRGAGRGVEWERQGASAVLEANATGEEGDVVLVDAGSSGTKVFTFSPAKAEEKLLTQCSEANQREGRTLQGIASLSYDKADCEWQIGPNAVLGSDVWAPLPRAEPDFAETVLKLLAGTFASSSGKAGVTSVKNRNEVPIMATAGMRLVSQEGNAKVWSYVCGKNGSGFTFAPAGESCGTIPGTTEAYYEFLSNAAQGEGRRDLTGTFTIGGASAQIAIPLRTARAVEAFRNLSAAIAEDLDCQKLTLADGSLVPVFSRGGPAKAKDARLSCLEDYIAFRPAQDIRASKAVLADNVKVSEIEGLGLISFLGLEGRGSFVAGGLNQVAAWAREQRCDSEATDFAGCTRKLQAALSRDVMWKHVTRYFREAPCAAQRPAAFSYNTYAAVASSAGLSGTGDGADQAWRLRDELNRTCSTSNGARFGYKDQNTCMKALFTSLYVTAFFAEPPEPPDPELHADPKRDWSEGKVEELSLLSEERHRRSVARLLDIPLRRHAATYIDGARIHLAATMAVAGGVGSARDIDI